MTITRGLVLLLQLLSPAVYLFAEDTPKITRKTYTIKPATSEIRIDGIMEERAWKEALVLELNYETRPANNTQAPVRTECYLTYDSQSLYLAFKAFDPHPEEIRAYFTDRDRAFQDDFVGLVLDTFNDERRGFEFFVNPLGVQMDMFQDDVGGTEDETWDAIWTSAGKITSEGYVVEIEIPFPSLRFPGGEGEQTWGIDVIRMYPRNERHRISIHPLDRNINCYLCQATKIKGIIGVNPGRNLEFVPTFTAGHTNTREEFPNGSFSGNGRADPGLTASWGITPNYNLILTANPDFSQVEADVAQLDVNEQFALFFPEKRPFFLEGADFFATPLQTVFTRNVADPIFGTKLTGKSGKNVTGILLARDEITNLLLPGSQSSISTSLPDDSTDVVLRYRRDIGESSTVGVLYTGREGSDYFNRVLGADTLIRFTESDNIRIQVLGSTTQYPDAIINSFQQPAGSFASHAIYAHYNHSDEHWNWYAQYEDRGTDFRADMGFLPRVDIRLGLLGGGYTWQPENKWYNRLFIGADADQTNDQEGNLIEREIEAFIELSGPWQSFSFVGPGTRKRVFNGVTFDQKYVNFFTEMTPTGSFYFKLDGTVGDDIDFVNTRAGKVVRLIPGARFKVGRHLQFHLDEEFERLTVENQNLFSASLTQLKIIYQFNVRTFIRAILQYTKVDRNEDLYTVEVAPESRRLFNQFLFSYKINPQTVLFIGYSDNHFGERGIDLTQTDRTIFFKIGYAWRP